MAPSSPGCRPPAPGAESEPPSADLRICRKTSDFGYRSCSVKSMDQSLSQKAAFQKVEKSSHV